MAMPLIACLFALTLAVVPAGSGGQDAGPLRVISEGPATQYGATQFVVHSQRVGRDFLVKVTPPFDRIPAGQRRPEIYALDGGYELAGPVGWQQGASGVMAEAWIISISYQPADFHWRGTDLAHVPMTETDGTHTSAGGAAFEAFLLQELRPFIEGRYAADPQQAFLFGHSRGGLFAATVFAEHPDAFRGYLIASASIQMNPTVLQGVAKAAAQADGRRFYVAVGGAEAGQMLTDEKALVAALTGSGSKAIVTSRVYEGATHLSYYPRLVLDGFPWLLPPQPTQ